MTRLELIGNNSNSISSPILIGRELLEVSVDGVGRSKLISAGTPTGQEVKFDITTGTLSFAETIELGTQIFVLYQNA